MARLKESDSKSRLRILEAATDEFAESGFFGARVDRIAQRAGINKAMIYYHFSSKENLYKEILNKQFGRIGDAVHEKIVAKEGLEAVLLRISELYNLELGGDRRFIAIFLHELAQGGKLIEKTLTEIMTKRGVPRQLRRLLEEGMRQGIYQTIDSRQAILSFIGMNLFYLFIAPMANNIWEINDEQAFRRNRPAEVVRLFLHGIKK